MVQSVELRREKRRLYEKKYQLLQKAKWSANLKMITDCIQQDFERRNALCV
jgi:hypothetical protein